MDINNKARDRDLSILVGMLNKEDSVARCATLHKKTGKSLSTIIAIKNGKSNVNHRLVLKLLAAMEGI